MADQQSNFFDTFTGSEAERMEIIVAELDGVPWAQGILHGVQLKNQEKSDPGRPTDAQLCGLSRWS
jgi:hypothetical protein